MANSRHFFCDSVLVEINRINKLAVIMHIINKSVHFNIPFIYSFNICIPSSVKFLQKMV